MPDHTESEKWESFGDAIRRSHPYRWRWEWLKFTVTEFLASRLNIHIDW